MAAIEQATEAQIGFIKSLLRERDTDQLTEEQRSWLDERLANGYDFHRYTRNGASRIIGGLQALPRLSEADKARTQGGPQGVPNGRYAIEMAGTLKFYKVNSPTEGRWAGRTFVDVQASDELHAIRNPNERRAILAKIAEDVQGAMLRYGQQLGHCGHCGRTLTNELSRELGIGPICRGKMGW